MKLDGTIIITDQTTEEVISVRFFKNGEAMYNTGDQNTRISYLEAKQLIDRHGCDCDGGRYNIDGVPVKFTKFLAELLTVQPAEARVKDEDYREQYIEHTPLEERHNRGPEPDEAPEQDNFWM